MSKNKKYRIAVVKDFPMADPKFIYFDNLDESERVITEISVQKSNGRSAYAAIEYWDDEEQEWLFLANR
jgi:hypothetical protein